MCKPSDYSPFVGRQRLSSFVVWHVVGCKSLFSRCPVPPNLCKSTQIMIETAILRALFISCYHFYAYLCTKVLISDYKEKICL